MFLKLLFQDLKEYHFKMLLFISTDFLIQFKLFFTDNHITKFFMILFQAPFFFILIL